MGRHNKTLILIIKENLHMKNLETLAYTDPLFIEGGCKKCKNYGREIGRAIRDSAAWQAIESAYDEVKSWFD